jgi:hypothetical protein
MIATGGKIPLTPELEMVHERDRDSPMLIDDTAGRQMDIKGKGKEGSTETEDRQVAITDITNGEVRRMLSVLSIDVPDSGTRSFARGAAGEPN